MVIVYITAAMIPIRTRISPTRTRACQLGLHNFESCSLESKTLVGGVWSGVLMSVFGIRYDFCIKINLITSKLAQDQKVRAPWLYTLEVLMSTKFSGRCLFDSLQRSGVISLVRVRMRTSHISRLPRISDRGLSPAFPDWETQRETWTRIVEWAVGNGKSFPRARFTRIS